MGTYSKLLQQKLSKPASKSAVQKKVKAPAQPKKAKQKSRSVNVTSRHHDITTSINHDINQSHHHDVAIEEIRKSVRSTGKDLTSLRLTPEETKSLRDIAYTYESQGYRTSRNEIARIGINYLISDYRQNGKSSILEKVVKALKA